MACWRADNIDGEMVSVVADGPLADLAAQIERPGAAIVPVERPPPGLIATLRPYQQRGLAWLTEMCEPGWADAWPTTWGSARRCR